MTGCFVFAVLVCCLIRPEGVWLCCSPCGEGAIFVSLVLFSGVLVDCLDVGK